MKSRVVNWDALAAAAPANVTASVVTGRGTGWEPIRKIYPDSYAHGDLPFPTRRTPRGTIDLTGKKIGRLTVIGLSATKRGRWVARCVCGIYEMRSAKFLCSAGAKERGRCMQCDYLAEIREGHGLPPARNFYQEDAA